MENLKINMNNEGAVLGLNISDIRSELGLSQSELAALVGIGKRAIQSYEQGWRKPSEMVERMILLLLIAHRNGPRFGSERCWEAKKCQSVICDGCIAYITGQGHICWFLTGTICSGKMMTRWKDKLRACLECEFMQRMLHGAPAHPNLAATNRDQ